MKFKGKRKKWWDVREVFFMCLSLSIAVAGAVSEPQSLGGWGCGVQFGLALSYFLTKKTKDMIERNRRQDWIDIRTMHDLTANVSYKMLHQIDKAPMN